MNQDEDYNLALEGSKSAYQGLNERKNIGEYNYNKNLSNEYIAVYEKGNKILISHRGTNTSDPKQLTADLLYYNKLPNYYLKQRTKEHEDILTKIGNKEVLVSGHSLGAIVASKQKGNKIITFNRGTNPFEFSFPNKRNNHITNYKIIGDPISNLGRSSGKTIYKISKGYNPHSLNNF